MAREMSSSARGKEGGEGEVFCVDLSQPLVFQVGHLGERYEEWVHQPIVTRASPRFFRSSFCEFFSRTSWWVIPVVWLPVVAASEQLAYSGGLSELAVLQAFASGIVLWSLIEYSMHRFLFHQRTSSYWGNTLHYLLHGCHHKHPMDRYRLVFPPALAALFICFFHALLLLLLPTRIAMATFGGGLFGYVAYDLTHFYLHHGFPSNPVAWRLKRYHMDHHFKHQKDGFGITSSFWDLVFGTLPTPCSKAT